MRRDKAIRKGGARRARPDHNHPWPRWLAGNQVHGLRFIALLALGNLLLVSGCSCNTTPPAVPSRSTANDRAGDASQDQQERQSLGLLAWERAPKDVIETSDGIASPGEIFDPPWLAQRRDVQLATKPGFEVFCDFQFEDSRHDSGITFMNRTVDDAGKSFKAVHYDHGNGVAVADVDGDGLLDIYFSTQLGSNELWRNRGGGKFENWTERAGVAVSDHIGVAASFADTDNDGDADLYVTTVRGGNVFFENEGEGRFRDISRESGLAYVGHSSGAVFFDYNRDGLLDLFLTNVGNYTTDEKGPGNYYVGQLAAFGNHLKPKLYEQSILFKNEGQNRFTDVSEEAQLVHVGWSGDACPLDLNEDGWMDLYVLSMQGHDEYYENVRGERFARKSREVFPATPWGAMGIAVFDYDNDSRMDLFITDMHTDMFDTSPFRRYLPDHEKQKLAIPSRPPIQFLATDGNHIFGNAFFQNDGGGKFTEVSDSVNAETYWPWGLSAGDLNADGYTDVFVTASMNYTFRYAVNSVLLNNRGIGFLDSEFILGVEPRRDRRTAKIWFELDCDGGDRDHPICAGRRGKVGVWGAVGSRASVLLDLDDDGDLDIVTNDFNSEPMVLISNLTDRKEIRFLKITLIGTSSNRDGNGARVTVTTDSHTLTKVNDGKSGYLSQSRFPLYFGLTDMGSVNRIDVQWPSGKTQSVEGPIEVNRHLVLREHGQ
jgi:hypothetical protein